jgi:hypothetical protein
MHDGAQITQVGVPATDHLGDQVADHIGGSRPLAAASDHHAARPVFESMDGVPIRGRWSGDFIGCHEEPYLPILGILARVTNELLLFLRLLFGRLMAD